MPVPAVSVDQTHPLYATDRDAIDRLLAVEVPADDHLVDAARLFMRYEGFPGAPDLKDDLAKALRLWGLSRDNCTCAPVRFGPMVSAPPRLATRQPAKLWVQVLIPQTRKAANPGH